MNYKFGVLKHVAAYLGRRLVLAVVTAFVVAAIVFFLIRSVPGDIALVLTQQSGATPEQLATIRAQLGLDQPVVLQFLHWVGQLATGDLGVSYVRGTPNAAVIGPAAVDTFTLGGYAVLFAVVLGLVLGNLGASRRRAVRRVSDVVEVVLLSAPQYTVALVLLVVFAVVLHVVPSGGFGDPRYPGDVLLHLTVPAIALALPFGAQLGRSLKTSMLNLQSTELLPVLVSRGLSAPRISAHLHQNALPPAISVLGFQIGTMLGGTLFVETIFSIPGLGQQLVQAVGQRDYSLVEALTMVIALVFIGAILLADVVNLLLDPRLRRGRLA
jgi:peptide/nickel transport system permease protein